MSPPINKDNVGKVDEVYNKAIRRGLSKGEAQLLALKSQEELEVHLECHDQKFFPVRKILSFCNLGSFPSIQKYGGWDKMTIDQKKDFLWEVGLDSREYGWKTGIGYHRELGGKQVLDKYIESNERTDNQWLTKLVDGRSVASLEAKVYAARDQSLEAELRKISNTNPTW